MQLEAFPEGMLQAPDRVDYPIIGFNFYLIIQVILALATTMLVLNASKIQQIYNNICRAYSISSTH